MPWRCQSRSICDVDAALGSGPGKRRLRVESGLSVSLAAPELRSRADVFQLVFSQANATSVLGHHQPRFSR